MAEGLAALGVPRRAAPDGIRIEGGQRLRGGAVDSHGDHRIAMAFAVASAARRRRRSRSATWPTSATSFPGFVETAARGCGPATSSRQTESMAQRSRPAPTRSSPSTGRAARARARSARRGRGPARLAPARQRCAVSPGRAGRQRRGPRRRTMRPAMPGWPQAPGRAVRPRPGRRGAGPAGRRRGRHDAIRDRGGRAWPPRGWRPCPRSARHCWTASAPSHGPRAWWPTDATWAPSCSPTPSSRSSSPPAPKSGPGGAISS